MNDRENTQPLPTSTSSASGFHVVNVGHLVVGVALLGLVITWGLVVGGAVADDSIRWLLPVPWVSAGFAGLLAIVFAARRRNNSLINPDQELS